MSAEDPLAVGHTQHVFIKHDQLEKLTRVVVEGLGLGNRRTILRRKSAAWSAAVFLDFARPDSGSSVKSQK